MILIVSVIVIILALAYMIFLGATNDNISVDPDPNCSLCNGKGWHSTIDYDGYEGYDQCSCTKKIN